MVTVEDIEAINVDIDAAEAALVEARSDVVRLRVAGLNEEADKQDQVVNQIATDLENLRRAFPREE